MSNITTIIATNDNTVVIVVVFTDVAIWFSTNYYATVFVVDENTASNTISLVIVPIKIIALSDASIF